MDEMNGWMDEMNGWMKMNGWMDEMNEGWIFNATSLTSRQPLSIPSHPFHLIHLIPSLLRFGFTFGLRPIKNTDRFRFPICLNLAPFVDKSSRKDSSCVYQLWAVVCHIGNSLRSGHYVTYAKVPNGNWYCFDDESVIKVWNGWMGA